MKKIALIAALVFGTAGAAFAEDSSSSFPLNVYTQAAQAPQHQAPTMTSRNVALGGGYAVTNQAPATYDRASSPYAGGGF